MAIVAQVATGRGSSDANDVTTIAQDTTAANFIVLVVASYVGVSAPTPTDSQSNTWTGRTIYASGASERIQLWYAVSASTSASHTFSVSTSSGFPSICMLAFSGVSTSSPYDVENGTSLSGGTSPFSVGSVTPSQNDEVLVTGMAASNFVDASSIDSSFSLSSAVGFSGGLHWSCAIAYKVQTSAGAENPQWTTSPLGYTTVSATIATFKAAAAVTGNPWYAYAQQRTRARVPRWLRSAGGILTPNPAFGKVA